MNTSMPYNWPGQPEPDRRGPDPNDKGQKPVPRPNRIE
jgi:hypothetical protein